MHVIIDNKLSWNTCIAIYITNKAIQVNAFYAGTCSNVLYIYQEHAHVIKVWFDGPIIERMLAICILCLEPSCTLHLLNI